MASIQAGSRTIQEILDAAKFDFAAKAAADYNDGQPDFRRVKVGGLGFDSLDKQVTVPPTADVVEITLDGKKEASLDVTLDETQEKERKESFKSADMPDPRESKSSK